MAAGGVGLMAGLRSAYDWLVRLAAGPYAIPALAAVSFAESSFFPIPPDLLLIPMVLATPRRAWWLAAICTAASVVGGFLGYAIGYYLLESVGEPLLRLYGGMDRYEALKTLYQHWGALIILIKGATPIPFKLVTIASGAFHLDLTVFALSSIVSRGFRFFLVAALLWRFGEPIRIFVEKRLALVTTVFVVMLVGAFVVLRYV
jgi:membrane protein YqaA with SNARE-associated domain